MQMRFTNLFDTFIPVGSVPLNSIQLNSIPIELN